MPNRNKLSDMGYGFRCQCRRPVRHALAPARNFASPTPTQHRQGWGSRDKSRGSTPIHCYDLLQKRACLPSSPKRNESLSAHREKPRLQVKAEHLPFIFREVGAMAKRLTIHGESIVQSAGEAECMCEDRLEGNVQTGVGRYIAEQLGFFDLCNVFVRSRQRQEYGHRPRGAARSRESSCSPGRILDASSKKPRASAALSPSRQPKFTICPHALARRKSMSGREGWVRKIECTFLQVIRA